MMVAANGQAGYGVVLLIIVIVAGLALLLAALWPSAGRPRAAPPAGPAPAWRQYRFGYTVTALIFLAFDMEMIFMYPWAVVFAEIGVAAFLDMMVFIALLSAGVAYAWGMGGLEWE